MSPEFFIRCFKIKYGEFYPYNGFIYINKKDQNT